MATQSYGASLKSELIGRWRLIVFLVRCRAGGSMLRTVPREMGFEVACVPCDGTESTVNFHSFGLGALARVGL